MSLLVNWVSWGPFPIDITKITMKSIITIARTAAPTVESTPCNPIFAKIDTRAAYDETKIPTQKCKIMLVRDDVAKGDTLDAAVDTGQIAKFAKSELARAISTPTIGVIEIPMKEKILPGQLAHIHYSKKRGGAFRIDKNFRIIEVKQFFGEDKKTRLTLTDDVKSSHPTQPTDLYNSLVNAVAPDFQDLTRSSILAAPVDIEQTILGKNYDTSGWF